MQLSSGSSSGDSALGLSAANVVSFGEDACAHIYVATIGGTVYRLAASTSGPFPCEPPSLPSSPTPPATLASATTAKKKCKKKHRKSGRSAHAAKKHKCKKKKHH